MTGQRAGEPAAGQPGCGPAGAADRVHSPGRGRRRGGQFSRDVALLIGFAALFTILTKAFVAQAFLIPSGSMEQTLRPGDRVLVNKLVYRIREIDRGDIVVFSGTGSWGPPPRPSANPVARWYRDALTATGLASNGTDYIKRVIGLPGDHVACCDSRGRITVNGVPLREGGYLYPGERPSNDRFSVTVPPGRLWVMGDNRADSVDSRDHVGDPGEGTIPESAVVGRAFLIIWPPSQLRSLPIPSSFSGFVHRVPGTPALPGAVVIGGILPLSWTRRPPRRGEPPAHPGPGGGGSRRPDARPRRRRRAVCSR
jgi:signal peptidase I